MRRRHRIITGGWTAKRQAWLERLERGPASREANVVGFECMQLGWTDWIYIRDGDDRLTPTDDEQLTDAGRAKLNEWRDAPGGHHGGS